MYKITKTFGEYPFAHRQHVHRGHCKYVHGHNWRFKVELESETLDENGFVYDFGNFKDLKKWFEEMFDHTLLINHDDPMKDWFVDNAKQDCGLIWDLRIVDSGSAEKLAEFVGFYIIGYLAEYLDVRLISVTVMEDNKNAAIWVNK